MKKVMITTKDLFYKKGMNERVKFCSNIAKRYHLNPRISYTNEGVELCLAGLKWNVVKYYIRTLNKEDGYIASIKRIIYILR